MGIAARAAHLGPHHAWISHEKQQIGTNWMSSARHKAAWEGTEEKEESAKHQHKYQQVERQTARGEENKLMWEPNILMQNANTCSTHHNLNSLLL